MTIISTGKLPTYDEEVAVRNQTDAMTPGWLATAITLCGEAQDATVRTYGKNEVNLFKPARHRVERAKVHSREMIECWNEFLEPHPFAAHLTRTNATEYILTVEQYEEFPQELPALFGEWLYNLRSALDYIIWAAAAYSSGRLPPHEDRLQYPTCDSQNSWKRTSQKLSVLPQHQLELLRTMQPFASDVDANYLGWINRLARIDRHRRLTIWAARIVTADPIAHIPSGVEPRWEWGERMLESGYCDLARLTFPDSESAEGVSVNPRLTIDPEVSEWGKSPFYAERKFDERIRMFMLFVLGEIDTYDYAAPATPAHEVPSQKNLLSNATSEGTDSSKSQHTHPEAFLNGHLRSLTNLREIDFLEKRRLQILTDNHQLSIITYTFDKM